MEASTIFGDYRVKSGPFPNGTSQFKVKSRMTVRVSSVSACELEESMIICDLCGETKDCSHREIEGKEYDICSECWTPLALKLKGKGRAKNPETVFLPPRSEERRVGKEC